ncbi:MAG: hypothetical protein ACNYVW_07200, partial [Methanosarcinales archaeon]
TVAISDLVKDLKFAKTYGWFYAKQPSSIRWHRDSAIWSFNNAHTAIGRYHSVRVFPIILQNLFSGSTMVTGSDLTFGLTVFSVGIGRDLAIFANVTISSIKKEQESEGSGILTSFRNLGCSMGTFIPIEK